MPCETCKFVADTPLHCRRYPPSISGEGRVSFPVVKADWSCGEYLYDNKRAKKSKQHDNDSLPQR